jgi:hypothetical protein
MSFKQGSEDPIYYKNCLRNKILRCVVDCTFWEVEFRGEFTTLRTRLTAAFLEKDQAAFDESVASYAKILIDEDIQRECELYKKGESAVDPKIIEDMINRFS